MFIKNQLNIKMNNFIVIKDCVKIRDSLKFSPNNSEPIDQESFWIDENEWVDEFDWHTSMQGQSQN